VTCKNNGTRPACRDSKMLTKPELTRKSSQLVCIGLNFRDHREKYFRSFFNAFGISPQIYYFHSIDDHDLIFILFFLLLGSWACGQALAQYRISPERLARVRALLKGYEGTQSRAILTANPTLFPG